MTIEITGHSTYDLSLKTKLISGACLRAGCDFKVSVNLDAPQHNHGPSAKTVDAGIDTAFKHMAEHPCPAGGGGNENPSKREPKAPKKQMALLP